MFDTCLNKVWYDEEEEIIHGISTGVFNLTSYSELPNDSISTSPDKYGVFPSFSCTTTFLASYFPFPFYDTFSLASSTAGFDTCHNKEEDEEEEIIIWGEGTGVFNLTSYSGLSSDFIIISPDKAGVFL